MNQLITFSGILLVFVSSQVCSAQPAGLPDDLKIVRQQIIDIVSANTTRTDNIAEVRDQLDPLIVQLEAWFIANRPANEVELTQVPWKNLWYDDPDISFQFDIGFLRLLQPRDRIFQVVEDGYYYNVSEFVFVIFGFKINLQNYLKGEYQILRPATEQTEPAARLNTVDLEFAANSVRLGKIPTTVSLSALVQVVDAGLYWTIPIPGPIGVTGELWNNYIDDELRISSGFDDSEPQTIDLYILTRVDDAE
jgi:hypothetical protein